MNDLINRKYPFRHRLISFLRDFDVKGIRKLSVKLPQWFLPAPEKVGRYILVTPQHLKFIIDPSKDKGVELSLHQTGTYEKGILHFINTHYKGKGAFVDVGANIGLMSISTAKNFPNSRVIAFEAHPETYDLLKNNITLNEVSNIDARQLAVGNEDGFVRIYSNTENNRGQASIVAYQEGAECFEVRQNSLDKELMDLNVEMIKIDVEGFEYQVLSGAGNIISESKPTLVIEVSEERSFDSNTNEILNFIEAFGFYSLYKLKGTKERKSALVEIKHRSELPQHDNIICIPNR